MGTKRKLNKAETVATEVEEVEEPRVRISDDVETHEFENNASDIEEEDEEEEELNGMEAEDEENEDEAVPDKVERQHHLTKKQKKQLSAQEIQLARETAELFKSNIFKLQIDELMKEVKIKESNVLKIEKVLHRLHELITKIPESEPLSLHQAESHFGNKKVVIPFPDPKPTSVNYNFQYLSPKDINLIGSFGLKTGINSSNTIDMNITMPSSLFQPKDYLNYRAFNKRAFYLAYIADNLIPLLKKNHLPIKLTYNYMNDDILCPIIKIESIKTDNESDLHFHKTKFVINLIVGFPFGIFDLKKLLPDKNCIRVQSDHELPPTPLYNSSLISSTAYDYYLKYLYTCKKSVESFKDACILGRLWLQQRGFSSEMNQGGFGHFEWAILINALLNGGGENGNKILLQGFSSYQLFKGTIKYLATMDLTDNGYLSFSSLIGENIASKYNNEGFNVPTIFDKNTKINILWKMTKFSFQRLQKYAQDSLVLLNDVVKDRFDAILLQKANLIHLKYDLVFNITIPEEIYDLFGPLEKISFISFDNFLKHKLFNIISNGLNDRITNIDIWSESPSNKFPINKRKPSNVNNTYFVGLSLNPEQCDKLVTKGPNNDEQKEGLKFKTFWGSKASLRRFKDGAIQHCVVWSAVNNEPIVFSIIKYCLDLHLLPNISQHLHTENTKFNDMLPTPLSGNQGVNSTSSFSLLKNSFDELAKVLTKLDLPLGVKTLLPASAALRYTSLLQPVPFAISNPDFWNECVLQFETSTRWPDEISSLEKTKTAFLLKIQEILSNETTYESFMTKDSSIPFNENVSLLNILTPEGYGFKIRVLTERDEMMYLRAVDNAEKNRSILQDVYLKFNQKYLGSVKHTRTVSQLSHHFQFYSATVRLFKLWLDSQLLLQHFNDELVELIALKPFVEPAPYFVPNSPENGLLQILNYVANWNWKEESLILDLVKNNGVTDDEGSFKLSDKLSIPAYQIIESNFAKIRKADPSGIKTQLFIASKDDPSGILWCNELTLPIATRLTALCRAAMQLVKTNGVTESSIDSMFTAALNDYDFVINVKGANLTASSGILPANTFKNLINQPTSFPEDVTSKYDLIQTYVEELNRKFGNIIIFNTKKFTGLSQDGSNVIGGIFVPSCLSKKKFKVNLNMNIKPIEGTDEVIINKDAIFNQITLMGGELIQSVDRK